MHKPHRKSPPVLAPVSGNEWAWFAGEALTALLVRLPDPADKAGLVRAADDAARAADLMLTHYRQRYR